MMLPLTILLTMILLFLLMYWTAILWPEEGHSHIPLIRQKHRYGCAIACIAMLTGRTYQDILQVCYPHHKFWHKVKPVVVPPVLDKLKLTYRISYPPVRLFDVKHDAIVIIQTPEGKQDGMFPHAVVWNALDQKILDPDRPNAFSWQFYEEHLKVMMEIIPKENVS